MLMGKLASLFLVIAAANGFNISPHRPATSTWQKTQCGGPSGSAEIPTQWAKEVSAETTPLPAHPRPQLVRGSGSIETLRDAGDPNSWVNLNGLWEWEPALSDVPSFGVQLSKSILVPFPVESCLSGVAPQKSADIVKTMWYRLSFDYEAPASKSKILLHFGAVDWQSYVYMNGHLLGSHTGGYDGFSFDVTTDLKAQGNELLIYVFDPSDEGAQPNGKQRISAIDRPGGDQYTPSSGIWQTVWLEPVPESYISSVSINQASVDTLTVTAVVEGGGDVDFAVFDGATEIVSKKGLSGSPVQISIPVAAKLWSPESPHLYDLKISSADDSAISYFGLRTFTVVRDGTSPAKPLLNNEVQFLAGFLDQSWWPDGQYTAPTDAALASDLLATKMFGLNFIRLHQKVNPERWYYHADRFGIVVFQDMVQKYGGANSSTVPFFVNDLKAMVLGRSSHPSILQWTAFNEGDCWNVFNTTPYDVKGITDLIKTLDPTRPVDTDSGGGANDQKIADVNDVHTYPYPGDPVPSLQQYAMIGEFGGIGAFVQGKEWVPEKCGTYLKAATPDVEAAHLLLP